MFRFERFDGSLDDWGQSLSTFPDAEIFQTPAWMRFLAESQNATPVVAVLRDGNEIAGYFAGLVVRKYGIKILGSPFIGWTTDFMGIRLRQGVPAREALRALQDFAFRQLNCLHLEIADRRFTPDDVKGLGFESYPNSSYVVDLTPPGDVVYQGMSSKSCRYCIRRAAKAGVTVDEATDAAFADDYYAQLEDVFAKQHLVPTYDKRRVQLLLKHLLPTGNLLLLRARNADGLCIGTGLFLGAYRFSYFWGNASWRQYQHLCPNEALHWYAMRYWKRRGMQWYDLCGGRDYVRKYGGVAVNRFSLRCYRYRWMAFARKMAHHAFKSKQRLLWLCKRTPGPAQGGEPPVDSHSSRDDTG